MAKANKKNPYPEKRTMNLYYKPDRTTFPATVALYVLFLMALALLFGKLFIYDFLLELEDTREEYRGLHQQELAYEEELKDYEEIHSRYQMYSKTDDEASQTDRMEVLALLDEVVWPNAEVHSVSISGGSVTVQISGVNLKETAEIVRLLEESPIVLGTVVNTAATTDRDAAQDQVTANIRISLKLENGGED